MRRTAEYDRRKLLKLTGSGLILSAAASNLAASAPPGGSDLPATWRGAETIALWPSSMPSADGFVQRPFPANLPEGLLHGVARPEMRVFRPAKANGVSLLVIPGGSYLVVSAVAEGYEVAQRMTQAGYTVYVLTYRLPGEGWTDRSNVPLQDAQRAMRLIRARAVRQGLDTQKVAAIGFSAGGHLCASLATGFSEKVYAPVDADDSFEARPSAAGLIYPVTTLAPPFAHARSAMALLGSEPGPQALSRRSPAEHIGAGTPPLFLVHAVDDPVVPVQNSLIVLDAMQRTKRPVEAHFFPSGGHGFGLGLPGSRAADWPALFTAWLAANP